MTRHLRTIGSVLVGIGVLIILSWLIEPLRQLVEWFWVLPIQLQIGGVVAGIGLIIMFTSLLGERWASRAEDASLKDDPPTPDQI